MKKAGILLAVLAAAILLKTQVWDRLTRPSAAENNLDRAYSITEIQSAADDLYSGFGLLPEDFDWEAACREFLLPGSPRQGRSMIITWSSAG